MTTRKRTLVLSLLLIVLLLGAVTAGGLYLRQRALPVYVSGELPPSNGYANNTLTLGDMTYVSGKAEFRLWALDPPPLRFLWPIGRTDGDWRIYRPYGQTGRDYLYVSGFMMPQTVYRNAKLAPLELRDLRVREIRFPGRRGSPSTTKSQDAQLIAEVIASLEASDSVALQPDYDAGDLGYRLDLLPEQMPGLAYRVDTLITRTGQVYLSTDTELGQGAWLPAGDLFTRWVRETS